MSSPVSLGNLHSGQTGRWADGNGWIYIEPQSNAIDRANKILAGIGNGGGAIKAVYAALKRAGEMAKTQAGRFAAAEYTINKGSFMARTKVDTRVWGGSYGAGGMNITFKGSVIPLLEFNTHYSRGGRLQTTVKRSSGSAILEHAFAAPVFGKTAVFEHTGMTRGPLEQKFGPSTAQMMQNETVIEGMERVITETFDARIDHEIGRILSGAGGR